jgi:CubicO group peptidase (beta-lactamase class C family)
LSSSDEITDVVEEALWRARIPGAALAVIVEGELRLARGFGLRDVGRGLPMTVHTAYPIASTTKAMNAMLIGLLVEDGRLSWDAPVREYLPRFRMRDAMASERATLRDLVTMRTGLARHEWLWLGNPMSRPELLRRVAFLEFSSGFRERFQYNNLTPMLAGHIAEVVTGERWEELLRSRILKPLGMGHTGFAASEVAERTEGYQAGQRGDLRPATRWNADALAPAGGAVHSTVSDMARWAAFNLGDGRIGAYQLVRADTLRELQRPQVVASGDPVAPSAGACYALGWWVDRHRGQARISHTGYLNGVQSSVMMFPGLRLGLVAFINFGAPAIARLINEAVFDVLRGHPPGRGIERKVLEYERAQPAMEATQVSHAPAIHPLGAYAGDYEHPAYGSVIVELRSAGLRIRRNELAVDLKHWHFDVWAFLPADVIESHQPHPFDAAGRAIFHTGESGSVVAVSLEMERSVARIRFVRMSAQKEARIRATAGSGGVATAEGNQTKTSEPAES